MEVNLFDRNKEVWTRFKVSVKEYPDIKPLLDKCGLTKPVKESSRYAYFEAKGDHINQTARAVYNGGN